MTSNQLSPEFTPLPAAEDTDAVPAGRPGRGWTLAVVAIATFMLMLDLTVVNVALPDMQAAFNSSFADLQWVLDAYALALAVFLLMAGSLADRLGRRRIFAVGLIVFVLASLACGLAPNATALSVARGVQGLGGAVLFAVGPALIGQEYQGKDRGKAFGVFGAVVGLAIALGPLIGGALTSWDWRQIFLVNVPVGIVALIVVRVRVHESKDPQPRPLDWLGQITFCLGLALLVIAVLNGQSEGWDSLPILFSFVAAALLLGAFLIIERRAKRNAMFDLALLRNVTFNGLSVVTFLCAAATMSAIFLEISYAQNVLGLTAWQTGVRFLPLTLTLFVAAAVAGSLSAKISPRLLMGFAMLAIAAGLVLVTRVGPESSWTALLPSMVLTGLGMGVFNPPRASLSIAVAEPAQAGMASGVSETFQQVGTAVGIAVIGAIFHARVGYHLDQSPAATALGPDGGSIVAATGGSHVATAVTDPGLAAQLAHIARMAFVDGLTDVMVITAAVALVASVVGVFFIRRKDLHESAL